MRNRSWNNLPLLIAAAAEIAFLAVLVGEGLTHPHAVGVWIATCIVTIALIATVGSVATTRQRYRLGNPTKTRLPARARLARMRAARNLSLHREPTGPCP